MIGADYLLVPSLNEAAPMVFDEAIVLGVPVITTNTTSATEMIGNQYGIVCENSQEGLVSALRALEKNAALDSVIQNNDHQSTQFSHLLNT
jgi:glycosyltransferase involved in cell wall biosynthesis